MFLYFINAYCDYVIVFHRFIKQIINPKSIEEHILSLTRSNAFEFIKKCKKSKITLYPTRKERYLLYKLLKGKDSIVRLYSYGKEKNDTRKTLIIKKKDNYNESLPNKNI